MSIVLIYCIFSHVSFYYGSLCVCLFRDLVLKKVTYMLDHCVTIKLKQINGYMHGCPTYPRTVQRSSLEHVCTVCTVDLIVASLWSGSWGETGEEHIDACVLPHADHVAFPQITSYIRSTPIAHATY